MRMTLAAIGLAAIGLGVGVWATGSGQQTADQASAEQVTLLKVEGMTCGGCAVAVKLAAKSVDGVKDAKVSYEKGTAEVTYDASKTTPDAIARVISEKSGFRASVPAKSTS